MANTLSVTTPSDCEIVVTRTFAAPRNQVFASMTEPAWLQRWLTGAEGWSLAVCDVDLREGGAYRYVWRGPDGSEMGMGGVYQELVPPERTVLTEQWDQAWAGGNEDVVTTTLTEEDGHTVMTMTIRFPSKAARDAALASDMTDGMAASYDQLDTVLASMG